MKKLGFIALLFAVIFNIPAIAQIEEPPGSEDDTDHAGSATYKITEQPDGNYYIFLYNINTGNFDHISTSNDGNILNSIKNMSQSNGNEVNLILEGVTPNNWNLNTRDIIECHSITLTDGTQLTVNGGQTKVHDFLWVKEGCSLTVTGILGSIFTGDHNGLMGEVHVDGTLNLYGADVEHLIIHGGTVNARGITDHVHIEEEVRVKEGGFLDCSGHLTFENGTVINVENGGIIDLTGEDLSNVTCNFADGAIVIGYEHPVGGLTFHLNAEQWNFIGFPHATDLSLLAQEGMPNVWALGFDYTQNKWNEATYLQYIPGTNESEVPMGHGIFAWSDREHTSTHTLNVSNSDIDLTYNGTAGDDGTRWFALANPFSHSIDIAKFLDANTVQGAGVYVWNGTDWSAATATGEIKPFQGFFVNMTSGDATIDFHLKDLFYVAPAADATPANNDYVTLDVVTDGYPVAVKIAHNDAALTEYDIFDADKMFGSGAVAEPYFVSNGKYLCKEEINANSYTAAMNIKSSEARDVQIVASNIPEGYDVVLMDGEEEIALVQGSVYETQIASGENADRFKVVLNKKNNVSITDAESLENISVRNLNRNIIVEGDNEVRTEVFNMLGQKIFETADRNFMLDGVEAGAYIVKVNGNKSSVSQKIIVE